jgi:hypothetical protein
VGRYLQKVAKDKAGRIDHKETKEAKGWVKTGAGGCGDSGERCRVQEETASFQWFSFQTERGRAVRCEPAGAP